MVRQRRCCDECSRRRKKVSECKPRGPGNKCWSCAKWNRECSFVTNYPAALQGMEIQVSREEKRRQKTLETIQSAERMGIMTKEEAEVARENTLKPPPMRSSKTKLQDTKVETSTKTRPKIPTVKLEALIEKVAASSAAHERQQQQVHYFEGPRTNIYIESESSSSQEDNINLPHKRKFSFSENPTLPGPAPLWHLSSDNSLASSQMSLASTVDRSRLFSMSITPPTTEKKAPYELAAAAAQAAASTLNNTYEEPHFAECQATAAGLEPQDAAQVALLAWAAASAPPAPIQNGLVTIPRRLEASEFAVVSSGTFQILQKKPKTTQPTPLNAATSNESQASTRLPPALSVLAETAGLEKVKSVVLRVPGMMCLASCGATIDHSLSVIPETRVVGIDVPRRLVHCHTPADPDLLIEALNNVGFDSVVISVAEKSATLSSGSFTEFCKPPEDAFEWDIADTLGLISASCDRRCGGDCSCGPSCMCHWCPVHHPERSKSIRTAASTSPQDSYDGALSLQSATSSCKSHCKDTSEKKSPCPCKSKSPPQPAQQSASLSNEVNHTLINQNLESPLRPCNDRPEDMTMLFGEAGVAAPVRNIILADQSGFKLTSVQ